MRTMEFSGRNVDEAIYHGLVEMGLSIDQVNVEVVQKESKGLFGIGAKNAVIRITELEVAKTPVFEKPAAKDEHPKKTSSKAHDSSKKATSKKEPSKDHIEYDEELSLNNEAAIFLKDLLKLMKIDADVKAKETDDGLLLVIISDTNGLLIGRRGETLDAIQYLVSLYYNKNRKENAYRRVTIDTEGYRARREETLRKLARRNALRVVKTGRSVKMEPMNPYERRILHSSLQNFRGVTTYSEGEEPNRAVIIAPDK